MLWNPSKQSDDGMDIQLPDITIPDELLNETKRKVTLGVAQNITKSVTVSTATFFGGPIGGIVAGIFTGPILNGKIENIVNYYYKK